MVKRWEDGAEVVYGLRAERDENLFFRTLRHCYYRILKSSSNVSVPINVGSFQLLDRAVVDALSRYGDHFPHIPNLIASCGFCAVGVPYTWKKRRHGKPKNKFHHLFNEAIFSLISFSHLPMRFCLILGLIIAALSGLRAAYSIFVALFTENSEVQAGIPTLIVSLYFFAGIQLFFLGVIGDAVSSINYQTRNRPRVIERARINFNDDEQKIKPENCNKYKNQPHSSRTHSRLRPLMS